MSEVISLKNRLTPPLPLSSHSVVYLGIMCVLRPGKGVEVAIKTLTHLPEKYHLRIAGIGSDLSFLKKLSVSLNLSHRIEFVGWVSDSDKNSFFNSIHLFLNCSTYDTQCLTIMESISYATPVISVPNLVFLEMYPISSSFMYSSGFTPSDLASILQNSFCQLDLRVLDSAAFLLDADDKVDILGSFDFV